MQSVIGVESVVLGARKSQMANSEGTARMAGLVKVVQGWCRAGAGGAGMVQGE